MQSRRDFLRVSAVTAAATFSGCLDGIAGKVSSGVAWPPPRPLSLPDPDEVPDLSPPTWGESGVPHAFVYNDLATSQAGSVFHREWKRIEELIKGKRVQVSCCDYPLPSSEWSYPIAIAARSVQHHAGREAFLTFVKRVLRDFMPNPYFSKQRVLDAAEIAGAPRDLVKEDTESWRFYSVIEQNKNLAKRQGIENSVSTTILTHKGMQSRPVVTTSDRIAHTANELNND